MGNPNNQSPKGGNPPTSSEEPLTYENAGDDPKKLAELAGMTFSIENGDYVFTDNNFGTELRIEADAVNLHNNDGYLNQLIKSYDELPDLNKQSTPLFLIIQNDFTGKYAIHSSKSGRNDGMHMITLATSAFNPKDSDSLLRIMLHESFHGLDFMMGGSITRSGISGSKNFKSALEKDGSSTKYTNRFLKDQNGHPIPKDKLYKSNSDYLLENFAESASIVQLKIMGYGEHKIKDSSGKLITVNEWCENKPNLTKTVEKEIKKVSENPQSYFKKPRNYYTEELKDAVKLKEYGIHPTV